jgi:hypothetical protein
MVPHVKSVCKSSFFHIRNISKIRKFLSSDTTKTLIYAFVMSRIVYCNSLLYGQPKCVLQVLQHVLNCATKLIFHSKKYNHITLLLVNLHWLPIKHRITFKIALTCTTFKALHGSAPCYITVLPWEIAF